MRPSTGNNSKHDASDAELAADARANDQAAFDTLYRRYAPAIAHRLHRILGNPEDVEDVLQMTFLELHRTLERYDGQRAFGPWLHAIAIRLTSTYLRSRRRRWWQTPHKNVDVLPPDDGRAASPEHTVAVEERAGQIWAEMQRLPADQRIALTLFEIEQCTIGEVADLMGTSPQTASARVNSARARIAKTLAKRAEGRVRQ